MKDDNSVLGSNYEVVRVELKDEVEGINPHQPGVKLDGGKLRYDLIPWECVEGLCKVMTFGANKYTPNGWKEVDKDRYVAALHRHLVSYSKGERIDNESGLLHLEHALTNLVFLLYFQYQEDK